MVHFAEGAVAPIVGRSFPTLLGSAERMVRPYTAVALVPQWRHKRWVKMDMKPLGSSQIMHIAIRSRPIVQWQVLALEILDEKERGGIEYGAVNRLNCQKERWELRKSELAAGTTVRRAAKCNACGWQLRFRGWCRLKILSAKHFFTKGDTYTVLGKRQGVREEFQRFARRRFGPHRVVFRHIKLK